MPALHNHKWELVCQAYATGISQAEAYTAGGYKKDTSSATRLFKNPEIQRRCAEIIAERQQLDRQTAQRAAAEAEIDRAWVMRNLRTNALLAMRGHPLYDRGGNRLKDNEGNYRFTKPDHMAANRSLELLGREINMFINKHEVGGPGDFARLTEEELDGALKTTLEAFGVPEKMAAKLIQDLNGTYRPEE